MGIFPLNERSLLDAILHAFLFLHEDFLQCSGVSRCACTSVLFVRAKMFGSGRSRSSTPTYNSPILSPTPNNATVQDFVGAREQHMGANGRVSGSYCG